MAGFKTTISFGVVSIPVKIHNAVDDGKKFQGKFHKVCAECGERVKMPNTCPNCTNDRMHKDMKKTKRQEIERLSLDAWTLNKQDIQRVFEVGKKYIEINPEDLENLPIATIKEITILHFANREEIGELALNDPFYLSVDEDGNVRGGSKAYNLLVAAMEKTGKVAIAKHTIREREHLCFLYAVNGVLVLRTLRYQNEINDPNEYKPVETSFTENELKLAVNLVKGMTETFDHGKYEDNYKKALMEMLEFKIAHEGEVYMPQELPETAPTPDDDLVNALTSSLEKVRVR